LFTMYQLSSKNLTLYPHEMKFESSDLLLLKKSLFINT
jgi:hypothetical protein